MADEGPASVYAEIGKQLFGQLVNLPQLVADTQRQVDEAKQAVQAASQLVEDLGPRVEAVERSIWRFKVTVGVLTSVIVGQAAIIAWVLKTYVAWKKATG